MKSFYVLIVVCLGLTLSASSQYVTWTGPAGGNWNNAANWSPAGVPNSASRITLPANADIALDVSPTVHNIKVFNGTARIFAVADQLLTLTGGDTALFIASGAMLRDSSAAGGFFMVEFATGSRGLVRGTWYFGGPDDGSTYVEFPATGAVACEVFGTMQFDNNSLPGEFGNTTLHFNSGSTLQLTTKKPVIPAADYEPNSLIYISGAEINPVSNEELSFVGNVTYACPSQAEDLSLGLSGITIGGNLFITNTNGKKLRMFSNLVTGAPSVSNTINGNLQITGTSKFVISEAIPGRDYNLHINGNLAIGGQEFDMQSLINTATNLFVKGNIQHTAGLFTVSSPSTSGATNIFNIELNGDGNQILQSVSGILDNGTQQVNLRINKTTGSVSLTSSIAVGRLEFTSANKANINTGGNLLSVRKQTVSGDPVALQYNGTGFVEGSLQRSFATTNTILFPLGTGTTYRPLNFNPSSSTSSIYQVSLANGAAPTASGILAPLTGVAPYYWTLTKNAGADGNVELTLNGVVPGATSGDALVAAKLASGDWVSARGSAGTSIWDGSLTTGTVRTEPQSTYGYYTIGYGSHAALPVILTAFNAKKVSATAADLNWKITQNSTPELFEIMRSSDGVHFSAIGSVPGMKGKFSYAYTDNQLLNGNNFYKLQMHDRDGSITHSTIVVVMNGSKGVIISSLMPTMVQDRAKLMVSSSTTGTMQLVVTDISGRIIQQQQVSINTGNQEVWLNASRLAAGMFQVTGYINGEKTSTFRFIKR
jgi:hypothetical protein